MSEAWGTTGRVVLRASDVAADVRVDDVRVGFISPQRGGVYSAVSSKSWQVRDLPSRDAAVMWVLRRTAPDVWRAERPVVWRVDRSAGFFPWFQWDTDGHLIDMCNSWAAAYEYADRAARAEYARAAR